MSTQTKHPAQVEHEQEMHDRFIDRLRENLKEMGVQQLDAHIERLEHLTESKYGKLLAGEQARYLNDLEAARREWEARFPDVTPLEVDTELAELFSKRELLAAKRVAAVGTVMQMAGGERRSGVSRSAWFVRGTPAKLTFDAAVVMLQRLPDERVLRYGKTPAQALAAVEELDEQLQSNLTEVKGLEDVFLARTWSRFFLVTSSAGHVHRSRSCPTCRPTTTFGWLPELSGKTEADAVALLGPALCSTCFSSAPAEMVGGKVTKAAAAKAAA